jgi:hypothetical protein
VTNFFFVLEPRGSSNNDLALLEVDRMLGIQPICVPDTVVKTACGDTTAGRVNLFDIVVVVVVVFVVACECFEQIFA